MANRRGPIDPSEFGDVTNRTNLLLSVNRELGEHKKAIQVMEHTLRQQTLAIQEVGKTLTDVVTKNDCQATRREMIEAIGKQITSSDKRMNGIESAIRSKKFFPKDINGWLKMIGSVIAGLSFLVGIGWAAHAIYLDVADKKIDESTQQQYQLPVHEIAKTIAKTVAIETGKAVSEQVSETLRKLKEEGSLKEQKNKRKIKSKRRRK